MSWGSDVNVAGVRVRANHVPELVNRLRWAGYPFVASKLQQVLDARTHRIGFGPFEREAIVRALPDRPPQFTELCAVLLRELDGRRAEPLGTGSELGATSPRRPRGSPSQALQRALLRDEGAAGDGSRPRAEDETAGAARPGASGRPKVTVTQDTLRVILWQSLERARSTPPQPSYQQIADANDVKRTWVTPIVKWAENNPGEALDAIWMTEVPARFSTIVRE